MDPHGIFSTVILNVVKIIGGGGVLWQNVLFTAFLPIFLDKTFKMAALIIRNVVLCLFKKDANSVRQECAGGAYAPGAYYVCIQWCTCHRAEG